MLLRYQQQSKQSHYKVKYTVMFIKTGVMELTLPKQDSTTSLHHYKQRTSDSRNSNSITIWWQYSPRYGRIEGHYCSCVNIGNFPKRHDDTTEEIVPIFCRFLLGKEWTVRISCALSLKYSSVYCTATCDREWVTITHTTQLGSVHLQKVLFNNQWRENALVRG